MLGFTPAEVRAMTLDELNACVAGWNRAQGTGPAPALSKDDYGVLCALADQFNGA